MLTNDDLHAIKGIISEEVKSLKSDVGTLKNDVGALKTQMNTVELKVELVNKRIGKAQEETIEALSELIHTGYNLHEERIKKLEKQQKSSHAQ